MNSIYAILKHSAIPKANGFFDTLLIGTKSGNKFSGTLAKWKPEKSTHIVVICHENDLSYVEIDSIESVTIANPERN